jgi:hypothetical protein
MENITEPTSEAPAKQSGADNPNAILSIEDLTSSFMEKVEENKAEEQTETDAVEETDATEAVESEEEQEGEVLLQSDTEEDSEEESDDDGSDDSQSPKGLQKALKRINQLTARAKGAEEEVASLKAQVESLKSQPAQTPQPQEKPTLENVSNMADLETLRKEAVAAKKFALANIGKDYVEVDGTEYSDSDIRNILTEAEDYLSEKIPQRAQFLQEKQYWVEDTIKTFPWSQSGEGEEWQLFQSIREGKQYKQLLDQLPNGDFIAATVVEGINAIKARQAKAQAKPKAKAKTPPPMNPADAVAPPAEDKKVRQEKKKQAILGKGPISAKQFAQYLNV